MTLYGLFIYLFGNILNNAYVPLKCLNLFANYFALTAKIKFLLLNTYNVAEAYKASYIMRLPKILNLNASCTFDQLKPVYCLHYSVGFCHGYLPFSFFTIISLLFYMNSEIVKKKCGI